MLGAWIVVRAARRGGGMSRAKLDTFARTADPRHYKAYSRALYTCVSPTQKGKLMTVYGYARVSTDGQSLDAQVEALKTSGATRIAQEKASGARTDRVELRKALDRLESGDVLLVTRLDRLARSTRDLLNVIKVIADAGAQFRSLADPWADTTTPHGRLMLTVLGGLAEFERELITARTGDGRKRAQERGVRFGRPSTLTAHQRREAIARRAAGETNADIARSYAVHPSTISRLR